MSILVVVVTAHISICIGVAYVAHKFDYNKWVKIIEPLKFTKTLTLNFVSSVQMNPKAQSVETWTP